jgi:YbbR domain-containing protein
LKFGKPISLIFREKFSFSFGAFLLATLLWVFVVSDNEYTMLLDFPIEARNLNVQKAHKREVPSTASVLIRGTGRDLVKSFLLKKIAGFKLVLDLEGISQEYEFYLNDYFEKYPQKVVLPLNYNVSFVEVVHPNRIKISLDDYILKNVPVALNLVVNPAPGYVQIGETLITPSQIEIAGPEKELDLINYVENIKDTLNGLISPYIDRVELNSYGGLVEYSHDFVEINIDIQNISERIIADIPVEIINVPRKIRVFPSPQTISLTVIGGFNRIALLNSNDIDVIIDFNMWNPQKQFYEPEVFLPEDVLEWKDLSPKNLEIAVARELD